MVDVRDWKDFRLYLLVCSSDSGFARHLHFGMLLHLCYWRWRAFSLFFSWRSRRIYSDCVLTGSFVGRACSSLACFGARLRCVMLCGCHSCVLWISVAGWASDENRSGPKLIDCHTEASWCCHFACIAILLRWTWWTRESTTCENQMEWPLCATFSNSSSCSSLAFSFSAMCGFP